jgi:hypothetical protein
LQRLQRKQYFLIVDPILIVRRLSPGGVLAVLTLKSVRPKLKYKPAPTPHF